MKPPLIFLFFVPLLFIGCRERSNLRFDGKVTGMMGEVQRFDIDAAAWKSLDFGASVSTGDSIRTPADAQLEITFNGENTLRLDQNTSIRIREGTDSSGLSFIEVHNGGGTVLTNLKQLAEGNDRYRVTTPTSAAVVKGTVFSVHHEFGMRVSHVHCFEGRVWAFNPFIPPLPPVVILPGFFTSIPFGVIPVVPVHIPPGQWKKLHGVMPHPMFMGYTKKFKVKGVNDLWLLPAPVDIRGKHLKFRPGVPVLVPGMPGKGAVKGPFKPGKGSGPVPHFSPGGSKHMPGPSPHIGGGGSKHLPGPVPSGGGGGAKGGKGGGGKGKRK